MSRFIDGRHLRAARTVAGLNQAELAAAAGIHFNSVKYWENSRNGRPAGWAVDRIVQALANKGVVAGVIYEGGRPSGFIRFG